MYRLNPIRSRVCCQGFLMILWLNRLGKTLILTVSAYLTDSISADDVTMADVPADSSPSLHVSSHLATFQPATCTLSSSALPTATPGSTTTRTSEDGKIICEYCKSEFKLGKNGRRGQASNLRKHRRNHHPETMADYRRVLHECRWGCGARDPDRSNIRVHERKYCSVRKGKQPRRRGKWREAAVGA